MSPARRSTTQHAAETRSARHSGPKQAKPTTETGAPLYVPQRLTERAFMNQVVLYARMMGWRTYHTYDARRSDAGFPDLVMVRRPRVVFAELKRDRGSRVRPDQQAWLDDLRACGQEVFLWKPKDWEEIERVLR